MALASLSVGASPASAAYWRECGSQAQPGAGWYNVRARNINCRNARRVARRHQFDGTPFGFRCRSAQIGPEATRYFCRRFQSGIVQKVRFTYGS